VQFTLLLYKSSSSTEERKGFTFRFFILKLKKISCIFSCIFSLPAKIKRQLHCNFLLKMSVGFDYTTNECLLNRSIKKARYAAVVPQNNAMFRNLSFLVPPLALFLYLISSSWTLHKSRKVFASKNGCKEPRCKVPLKDPFLALDFVWKTLQNAHNFRYLEGTHERFQLYGTTFAAKHMNYPTIHTTDPANVKTVLSTRFEDFKLSSFRVNAMIPLFGNGIFTSDGQMWSHSRALLRPSFARHNMTSHLPFMEAHFEELMKAIPKDGSTVDLQKLFFGFTMDTATEFLFGHSVNTLSNMQESTSQTTNPSEISDTDFVSSYTYACLDAVHNIRLGALSKLRYSPRAIQAQKKAHAYIDRFVDEALELRNSTKLDTTSQYIFLNELAKETDDRSILRDQILSVLLAGRDTTASLLSNMFFELARNPVVYERLRAEIAGLKGVPPTYEELKDLKYLRYCINECSSPPRSFPINITDSDIILSEALRLRPVVPANTREAVRDTVLPLGGGEDGQSPMFVKKGTHVYYSVYSMHRREEFFGPNTEEYRPERWETIRPGWVFISLPLYHMY
jgi:cytochrome P450